MNNGINSESMQSYRDSHYLLSLLFASRTCHAVNESCGCARNGARDIAGFSLSKPVMWVVASLAS